MSHNPFTGFGKVVSGERMVGRNSTVSEIVDHLSDSDGSIAVIGMPRIGKTSVSRDIARQLEVSNPRAIRLWIDLSTIPSSIELFKTISGEIVAAVAQRAPTAYETVQALANSSVSDAYDAYRQTRRILGAASKHDIKTQIFNEFDSIRWFSDAQVTIQRLRDLVYHAFDTGACGVFASRRSLRAIELSVSDVSTLDGVCEQHYGCDSRMM
jgi:hypothetical protein